MVCELPQLPVDVTTDSIMQVYKYEDILTYNCEPGCSLVSGNLKRVCEATSAFSGTPPDCQRKTVPLFEDSVERANVS